MRETMDRRLRAALKSASMPSPPMIAAAASAPRERSASNEQTIAMAMLTNRSPTIAVTQRSEFFGTSVGLPMDLDTFRSAAILCRNCDALPGTALQGCTAKVRNHLNG